MRKTIIAIMSLVAMVACTNDITVMEQAPSAISFENSFVENKTRAAVDPSITTASIDAFDVWGFMDDPNGLMFDAQRVTKGEAGWTYSPLQFWAEDHNYYFYAVAPVDNANIVVNKDLNIQGLGTIDFTNTDGAVDLLYAEKQESTYDENVATNGHESVKFTFAHLLSKIKFTFTNGFPEGTSSLKIEDLKISQAPSKGTVTLNDDNAGRTWAITENNATLDFGHVNGGAALVPNQSEESDVERLTIPADANVRYQIDFKVTLYTGSNVAMVSNKTVYLENQAFVIGKNYNITATIDQTNIAEEALKPIEFDVVEVEEWIPGDYNGNLDYDDNGNPIDPEQPENPEQPEEPVEPGIEYTTVADFLAADVDDSVFYTLKGTITRVANTSYGNFDLTDETGTVYVYGLYSEDGVTSKYWAASGAKLGDDIVISAKRSEFNGSAQAGSARFVELLPGTLAFWSFSKDAVMFGSAANEEVITVDAYNLSGDVTVSSDNAQFTATYADGSLTISAKENTTPDVINGNITVAAGSLVQVITIAQNGVSVGGGTEVSASAVMAEQGWANSAAVKEVSLDDNVVVKFAQGKASNPPAYYTSGEAVRLYQNGATMTVSANGKTIKSMEITFAQSHYYMAPDCGEFSAEGDVRVWTGEATEVVFTTTGTDKNHRAYISEITVTYID